MKFHKCHDKIPAEKNNPFPETPPTTYPHFLLAPTTCLRNYALMRIITTLCLLSTLWALTSCVSTTSSSIGTVYQKEFPADQLDSLRHPWNGQAKTPSHNIWRSQAELPGYYFIVSLQKSLKHYPSLSQIRLSVQYPQQKEPQHFLFDTASASLNKKEIWLGLTGSDYPQDFTPPVAWTIQLEDASGQALAQQTSFLPLSAG